MLIDVTFELPSVACMAFNRHILVVVYEILLP